MSKTNETRADIVAEMRENKGFSVPFTQDGVKAVWTTDLVDYADRIEAARKRESATAEKSSAVGNMAAMCEALAEIVAMVSEYEKYPGVDGEFASGYLEDIASTAKAALAKPPRNCDVGTAEEQDNRMDFYCQTRKCESCQLWDNVNNGVRCEFNWAQMPYEKQEGCAK